MAWTDGTPSPEIFRLWSGITCIAGAMERRLWVESGRGVQYPNLYVMLVAPPGVGKDQAINPCEGLWRDTKGLCLAPDSVTSASMLDSFAESKRVLISKDGRLLTEFHGMLIAASEFIVFCPSYDLEFLGRLTKIYDCGPLLRVRRKYLKEEAQITKPYLTMITGAQPGILKSLFPDEAWSGGFTSRLIMIYAGEGPLPDLFGEAPERHELRAALLGRLTALSRAYGRFHWDTEAAVKMLSWHKAGGPPKPSHVKLAHYCTRRSVHVMKLCMVSSASRGLSQRITLPDVDRAIAWLLAAERSMPDIFRAMVGKNDNEIIIELHYALWGMWANKRKPIHISVLINFVQERVPHDKVLRLIQIAELGGFIKKVGQASDGLPLYEPIPRNLAGIIQ